MTIQNENMSDDDRLYSVKKHTKYLGDCIKSTKEVDDIVSNIDSDNLTLVKKLIDDYLEEHDDSDIIYHYCSMEAFEGILNSKSLWLSDSNFMNDKYEGRWVDKIVEEVLEGLKDDYSEKKLKQYKQQYDILKHKQVYMCCFSNQPDKLSQWRGYADDASGVAIGFSREAIRLTGNFDFELALMDVLYDKEEQIRIIKESVEIGLGNNQIELSKELAYFLKNPSFYEEEEVRFLYTPENNKNHIFANPLEPEFYKLMSNNISNKKTRSRKLDNVVIPYFEYDLSGTLKGFSSELIPKIVIGPRNRTDLKTIEELLKKQGLDDTIKGIVRSESSYI